jgi:acetyl-CoA acetyltransferase
MKQFANTTKTACQDYCSNTVGVEPRIMGFAPAPAIKKLLKQANLTLEQMDVIELNEAFAAQALAVTRDLGLADDDDKLIQTVVRLL